MYLHKNDRAEHVAAMLASIPEPLSKGRRIRIKGGTIAFGKLTFWEKHWEQEDQDWAFLDPYVEIPEDQWEDRKRWYGRKTVRVIR